MVVMFVNDAVYFNAFGYVKVVTTERIVDRLGNQVKRFAQDDRWKRMATSSCRHSISILFNDNRYDIVTDLKQMCTVLQEQTTFIQTQ